MKLKVNLQTAFKTGQPFARHSIQPYINCLNHLLPRMSPRNSAWITKWINKNILWVRISGSHIKVSTANKKREIEPNWESKSPLITEHITPQFTLIAKIQTILLQSQLNAPQKHWIKFESAGHRREFYVKTFEATLRKPNSRINKRPFHLQLFLATDTATSVVCLRCLSQQLDRLL